MQKTPAMKVSNSRNGITSRDESNSIKRTVARYGIFSCLDKKYREVFLIWPINNQGKE